MRCRLPIVFILWAAILVGPSMGNTEPDPQLRGVQSSLRLRGCVTQLAWATLGLGVLGTTVPIFGPPRLTPVPSVALVSGARSVYSPLLSREDKYFSLLDAAQIDTRAAPAASFYRDAVTKIQSMGLRLPDRFQPPDLITPRHPLIDWIAMNDTDPTVRSLASQLKDFGGFSHEKKVALARKYLGDSVPNYALTLSDQQKFHALLGAARRGLSPAQRRGLLAVEFGEGGSTPDGLWVYREAGLLALYLRLVPGFLDTVAQRNPSVSDAWFRMASENTVAGDEALAKQVAKVHKRFAGSSQADREVFEKLGPSVMKVWLEMDQMFVVGHVRSLIESNPDAYLPELRKGLRDRSAVVVYNSLGVLWEPDLVIARFLRAEILACLDHSDEKVRRFAAYVAAVNELFSPQELLDLLKSARGSSVQRLEAGLEVVNYFRTRLSAEERAQFDQILSSIEGDPSQSKTTRQSAHGAGLSLKIREEFFQERSAKKP